MPYDDARAKKIVGESRDDYKCNQVVNYVLNGNKDLGTTAKGYLEYGYPVAWPSKGVVVVGKDGVHVGIFISDTEFIHSSSNKKQVIRVFSNQVDWIWGKGNYEYRKAWF